MRKNGSQRRKDEDEMAGEAKFLEAVAWVLNLPVRTERCVLMKLPSLTVQRDANEHVFKGRTSGVQTVIQVRESKHTCSLRFFFPITCSGAKTSTSSLLTQVSKHIDNVLQL